MSYAFLHLIYCYITTFMGKVNRFFKFFIFLPQYLVVILKNSTMSEMIGQFSKNPV